MVRSRNLQLDRPVRAVERLVDGRVRDRVLVPDPASRTCTSLVIGTDVLRTRMDGEEVARHLDEHASGRLALFDHALFGALRAPSPLCGPTTGTKFSLVSA